MKLAVVTLADASRQAHLNMQLSGLRRWPGGVSVDHYRGVLGADRNLARTRNAAARRALADGAEALLFLDADCIPGPRLVDTYVEALRKHPGGVLSGPATYLDPPPSEGYTLDGLNDVTNPHPARPNPPEGATVRASEEHWDLFWSLSFALDATAWHASGGFDEGYVGYGGEDTDFAYRCRARGLGMWWVGGAHAYHQWHPVSSPPVEHLDDILVNAARFHRTWGVWPMSGWLEAFHRKGLIEWDGVTWRRTGRRPPPQLSPSQQ